MKVKDGSVGENKGREMVVSKQNQNLVRQRTLVMKRILVGVWMKGWGCRGILQGKMYQVIWSSGALEN